MVQKRTNIEWLAEGFRYELESTTRKKTVEYYCGEVRRFLRWANSTGIPSDISFITKHHIQAFFHHLASIARGANGSKSQPDDIERLRWPYYRALRRFFDWVVKEGYLEKSPMDGIIIKPPEPPPIEPYHLEQITRMVRVLDHDWQTAKTQRQRMLAARDKALLFLFLESGLRLAEVANLQIDAIDMENRTVVVRFGKMGKSRLSGFGPQTKKALWKYLSLRPSEVKDNALWATEEGGHLSVGGLQMIIRRLKKAAGLHTKGSVHKLRHTFATTFLRHTRDMKGCRLLLGHSTLAMTERYTRFIEVEDTLKTYHGKGPLDWLSG